MKFPHVLKSAVRSLYKMRERLLFATAKGGTTALQSPFPASTNSPTRTSAAFFPLDPKRELKPQARIDMVKKSRLLRNSSGVIRSLYEKPVKFACPGGLTPSATTPDPDYNEASDDYFERWAGMPVDVSGKLTFYDSVEMIAANMPADGEVFPLRVRTFSGRPQLQFLFTHQIGDHLAARDSGKMKFRDGVLENSLGRALAYRVLQDGPQAAGSYRDVSAEDMMHVFDPKRMMFSRGFPWAFHGMNSELDRLDMRALDMVARKLHIALAGVIKRTGQKGAGIGPQMSATDIAAMMAAANGETTPAQPESEQPSNITWEMILGGGAMPVLRENEEVQNLTFDRSPESMILSGNNIIREIATGYGVTAEFIWDMAALGGPGSRFILEDLNAFCAMLNRILAARYCQPTRSWVIANGIINGELQEPKAGNWWDSIWTGPPKPTIDRGRDGSLFVKLLEKGMLTLEEWWSMLGQDARKMRKKRIAEIKEDLAECTRQGVPYHLYMAAAPGTPAQLSPIIDPSSPEFAPMLQAAMEADPGLKERLAALLTQKENPHREF